VLSPFGDPVAGATVTVWRVSDPAPVGDKSYDELLATATTGVDGAFSLSEANTSALQADETSNGGSANFHIDISGSEGGSITYFSASFDPSGWVVDESMPPTFQLRPPGSALSKIANGETAAAVGSTDPRKEDSGPAPSVRKDNDWAEYGGSITAFGLTLGSRSGLSQYVIISMKFTMNNRTVCGNDGDIRHAHKIFAGV